MTFLKWFVQQMLRKNHCPVDCHFEYQYNLFDTLNFIILPL